MKIVLGALLISVSASLPAMAQFSDDSLLLEGPPDPVSRIMSEARQEDGAIVFMAEEVPGQAQVQQEGSYSGTLLLTDEKGAARPAYLAEVFLKGPSGVVGRAETDEDGAWSIPYSGPAVSVRIRLQNKYWSIRSYSSGAPYEWEASTGVFRLAPSSANGEIGFMHLQFSDALRFMADSGVAMDWWKRTVTIRYPGDANYYSGGAIVLTRAKAWDVNLHEFGHAVMYGGTDSYGGGGAHQISKCYTEGLAWSEGFATFFAGAVRLDPADPAAKFEYLAGGMALENVPAGVCAGDTNEWRVAAALWDIFDSNGDGPDATLLPYNRTWDPIRGRRMGGFKDAWKYIKATLSGEELTGVQAVFEHNKLPERLPVGPLLRP